MLKRNDTALIVVDVQGKLAGLMHAKASLFQNLGKIIRGTKILGLPVVWVEQNPEGLGPTVPEVAELLPDITPISKKSFSCWGSDPFKKALKTTACHQLLIAGIEAHVCIYQSVMDLLGAGFEVEVVADAVSSRRPEDRELSLHKLQVAGARVTSVEMALFELLETAEGDDFKNILKIVK